MEKGSFTPLVSSTSGGIGGEAKRMVKKLASKMEYHTDIQMLLDIYNGSIFNLKFLSEEAEGRERT